MHVLFVEPSFPVNQRRFVRALADVGARVTGIGEVPMSQLDDETKGLYRQYAELVRAIKTEKETLDSHWKSYQEVKETVNSLKRELRQITDLMRSRDSDAISSSGIGIGRSASSGNRTTPNSGNRTRR